jgi:hypothetical protein
MGYRSRRGSGEFHKAAHDKTKPKTPKNKTAKYVEEPPKPTLQDEAAKVQSSLSRLGTQTFALSPFSQYFDDWLVNLRQVLSEFEAQPVVAPDDVYLKERGQIIQDVEGALAQCRVTEAQMDQASKALAAQNHLMVETDVAYAHQTRELSEKRNCEIERFTHDLNRQEADLAEVKATKTSFFGFTKGKKAKREAEATAKVNTAKTALEVAVDSFRVEQEKLHDQYEKTKQKTISRVQALEKELVSAESDPSVSARKAACDALAVAVSGLVQRKAVPPSPSSQ